MNCTYCGRETGSTEPVCEDCRLKSNQVTILSPEERDHFDKMTIDQNPNGKEGSHYGHFDYDEPQHEQPRVFVFGSHSTNLLTRFVLGLVILGLFLIIFPFAFFFLFPLIIFILFLRLIGGR
jgi:hypothetical protein